MSMKMGIKQRLSRSGLQEATSTIQHKETTTMLNKTQTALSVVMILGTVTAAVAYAPSKYHRSTFESAATARAMVPSNRARHSSNRMFDVYDTSGRYIGSDPDPFIRSQLSRDPHPAD
jgi:hypothetical protein